MVAGSLVRAPHPHAHTSTSTSVVSPIPIPFLLISKRSERLGQYRESMNFILEIIEVVEVSRSVNVNVIV